VQNEKIFKVDLRHMKINRSTITKHIGASISKLSRRLLNLRKSFWWPALALVIVAGVWLKLKSDIPLPEKYSNENFGQYGDSFGALTSLFTALGFGGLIITLLLQQRQIRSREDSEERNRRKEAQAQYENVLFRLLEMYRQNLEEIQNGELFSRDVLLKSIERVEQGLIGEAVHTIPLDMQGRSDSKTLNESDKRRIEYLHFRNFKIIAAEINPQGRLLDTFEVLLGHMVEAPDYLPY
jgi:hypothetical protein